MSTRVAASAHGHATAEDAGPRRFVDFHNHVLAGVDDGARDEEESRAAVRCFVAAGAQALIATPHFDASLAPQPEKFGPRIDMVDRAWESLSAWAAVELPELRLGRGVELRLDVPDPDCSDPRLRLDGGRFVLVEFPGMSVPIRSEGPLLHLRDAGYAPILAHPERYAGFDEELEQAARWKDAGAFLQVNAGSITGRYGERARANALRLLDAGMADYLCSDYHSRGELATEAVLERGTDEAEALALLSRVNPERMLDGQPPLPVPLLPQRGWWRSLARALGLANR